MELTNTKYFCELCISEGHDIVYIICFDLSKKDSTDYNTDWSSVFTFSSFFLFYYFLKFFFFNFLFDLT